MRMQPYESQQQPYQAQQPYPYADAPYADAPQGGTPWRVSGQTGYGDETMRMRPIDPHEYDPRSNR
jgi:hypothetical protein